MDGSEDLTHAIVETTPPLHVYVKNAGDAERLANLTGCRVQVNLTYEPEPTRTKARRASAARAPTRGSKKPSATTTARSASTVPDEIRERIRAKPDRVFRAADFSDLADVKRVSGILSRLYNEDEIDRPRRGEFKALSGTAPKTKKQDGVTAGPKVLAFMQQHPGKAMKAAEVAQGMGLPEHRKGAIAASLSRLYPKALQKKGSAYLYVPSARPVRPGTEAPT